MQEILYVSHIFMVEREMFVIWEILLCLAGEREKLYPLNAGELTTL